MSVEKYKLIKSPNHHGVAYYFLSQYFCPLTVQLLGKPDAPTEDFKVKVNKLTWSADKDIMDVFGRTKDDEWVHFCINVNEHGSDFLSGQMMLSKK